MQVLIIRYKKMKTNTKVYRKNMKEYLNNILHDDNGPITVNEFFEIFSEEFEFVYNIKRYPNIQDRLTEYLKGLPSCICIDYVPDEIIKVYKKLHEVTDLPDTKYNVIVNNFFNHIAYMLLEYKEGKL